MALATSQLRHLYAPACNGKGDRYHGAYAALNTVLHVHRYKPRHGVTGAYNCRKITGGSGYSLHAYGAGGAFTFWSGVTIATSLAVDVNWDTNPYGPRLVTDMGRPMIDDLYRVRTNSGAQVWRWGGYYRGNKDAMHFEIVCHPADLATGVDPDTLPNAHQEELTVAETKAIMDALVRIEHESRTREERIITLVQDELPARLAALVADDKRFDAMLRDSLASLIRTEVAAVLKEHAAT